MRRVVAMAVVGLMLVGMAGCSKPPAADLLKGAQSQEELARKTLDTMKVKPDLKGYFAPVLEEYSRLVDGYEDAPESEVALFRRAVIYHNDLKEFEGAVEDYKLYAERYPESPKTPLVLFLVGYIYNNELHSLDSAGSAYRRFLQKFPEHEMASSARFELDNLGKSPDEMILQDPPEELPKATPRATPKATPQATPQATGKGGKQI